MSILVNLELKIPPPIVAAISAFLMWKMSHLSSMFSYDIGYKLEVCILIAMLGLLVDILAISRFMKAKTTVNPLKPGSASRLVKTGIYKYSRNPMYVGNFIILIAWGIWLGVPANISLLFVYVIYLTRFQIKPEEQALEATFKDEYRCYKEQVRRWI